jgi:hypothetical protein
MSPTELTAPSERNDLDSVVSFIPRHPETIFPIRSCASFATSDAACVSGATIRVNESAA